jgi:hypothetical protein
MNFEKYHPSEDEMKKAELKKKEEEMKAESLMTKKQAEASVLREEFFENAKIEDREIDGHKIKKLELTSKGDKFFTLSGEVDGVSFEVGTELNEDAKSEDDLFEVRWGQLTGYNIDNSDAEKIFKKYSKIIDDNTREQHKKFEMLEKMKRQIGHEFRNEDKLKELKDLVQKITE